MRRARGAARRREHVCSCGAPLELELLEVWPEERAFLLDACCEERGAVLLEQLQHAVELPAGERRAYLQPLRALLEAHGVPCRQVYGSWQSLGIRIDFGLELGPVEQATARAFVADHHRHNAPPAGWRWGIGCYNGDELVAIGWVGRAVARGIPAGRAVEVNRVCVDPGRDPELVWNACSMIYGAAAREAKRRGLARILTYTRVDEPATTLRAAGWEQVDSKLEPVPFGDARAIVKGRSWNAPSRPREDHAPPVDRVRWGKVLRNDNNKGGGQCAP